MPKSGKNDPTQVRLQVGHVSQQMQVTDVWHR
ncbi:hypothetical protein Pla108_14260 [Botrimarina colliarenosi]|uniref:Uncharacterized protein n=1 Tax=Botrimarina colliarenosi TaxID=2528001 RepID=A0A5C6AKA1_9BACT|nr:hypothetical protein Pla108_14260 [Botrimarina colliarenosi]